MSITDALAAKRTQEPETAPEPPAEKQKRDGTEYVVLVYDPPEREGDDGHWDLIGPALIRATSAYAAIAAVADSQNRPGTFVAVPARSWHPVAVTIESKPVVKLKDA